MDNIRILILKMLSGGGISQNDAMHLLEMIDYNHEKSDKNKISSNEILYSLIKDTINKLNKSSSPFFDELTKITENINDNTYLESDNDINKLTGNLKDAEQSISDWFNNIIPDINRKLNPINKELFKTTLDITNSINKNSKNNI